MLSDLDKNDGVDLGIVPVALDELHSDLASTDLALLALEWSIIRESVSDVYLYLCICCVFVLGMDGKPDKGLCCLL